MFFSGFRVFVIWQKQKDKWYAFVWNFICRSAQEAGVYRGGRGGGKVNTTVHI